MTTTRHRTGRAALGPLLAALIVAATACGSDGSGADDTSTPGTTPPPSSTPGPPATTGTTASSPVSSAGSPSAAPPTTVELSSTDLPIISGRPQPPPKSPTDTFEPFTTRGRVIAGSEPGCLELVTDSGRYVLVGELVTGLAVGDEVEVDARAAPNAVTTCQGDSVITVTAVRPV